MYPNNKPQAVNPNDCLLQWNAVFVLTSQKGETATKAWHRGFCKPPIAPVFFRGSLLGPSQVNEISEMFTVR